MSLRLLSLLSFDSSSFMSQFFLDNLHGKVLSRFQISSLGPETWRKTYKCHEDDKLFRKFHIDVIESSTDGFHGLDVTIDVKRSFFQLGCVQKGQTSSLTVFQTSFGSETSSSNLLASWIEEALKSSKCFAELVSIFSFSFS